MRRFVRIARDYALAAFWHWWVAIVLGVLTVIQTIEWFADITLLIPLWAKLVFVFIAFTIAQFLAYYELRVKTEQRQEEQAPTKESGIGTIIVHPPRIAQEKMRKLASFMNKGREKQHSVPNADADFAQVQTWVNAVGSWLRETYAFLSRECTPQAQAKFLDDAGVGDASYPGIAQEAQQGLKTLNRRLENLSKIMDRPEVYL